MPDNATLTLECDRRAALWHAINQIPEATLKEYLADNVIDADEIEDITQRIEAQLSGIRISAQDHQLLRKMVHQSVNHIRRRKAVSVSLKEALCDTTLGDIRGVMAQLVQSGQIALNIADIARCGVVSPNADIPDERPEDYDVNAENPL
jgi:hypothetical protein